jgi:small-conductance mechanosensitive channel
MASWLLAEVLLWVMSRRWLRNAAFDLQWRGFSLITRAQMQSTYQGCLGVLRWVLRSLAVVVALQILGLAHPDTEGLARDAFRWLGARSYQMGLAVVAYLPNLLTILTTLWAARAFLSLNRRLFLAVELDTLKLPGFDRRWALPTRQILTTLTLVTSAATILPLLPGAASPVFRGMSVLVGVLLSLGSGPAMTNIVSGFLLSYSNAFQVGDVIELQGQIGRVRERNLLVTRLRNFKNQDITLPNSSIIAHNITNFSNAAQEGRLILATVVTLGYEVEPKLVMEILLKSAQPASGWLLEPNPFVLHQALEGSWVAYELNVYVGQIEDWLLLQSNLRAQVLDGFHRAGVELMTPTLHGVRDANLASIPPGLAPEVCKPGHFRVVAQRPT